MQMLYGKHAKALATDKDVRSVILKEAKEQVEDYFFPDSCRIRITPRWIPSHLLQVKPQNITRVALKGAVQRYTNFEVSYKDGQEIRRVEIQLTLQVSKKIPVTTHRLPQGKAIEKKDLAYQWKSIFKYNGPLINDIRQLQGKILKHTLLAGQPIRQSYISRKYLIKAGDQVEIIIRRQGFLVQLSGEARENGAKGDEIKIYNRETRRKYVGEVIRHGVVIWKKTL